MKHWPSGAVALAAADSSATTSTTTPSSGSSVVTDDATLVGATEESSSPLLFTHYNVSPIAIAFFLVYAVSFALHKTKRIRLATHRKVWNVLLAATFLITGIFGLILTIQLDYELPFTIPFDLLFWHVEAGVAMTLISLFHLSWHFNYYRNVFRRSRKTVREARAAEKVRDTEERRLAWETRAQRRGEALPRRTSIRPAERSSRSSRSRRRTARRRRTATGERGRRSGAPGEPPEDSPCRRRPGGCSRRGADTSSKDLPTQPGGTAPALPHQRREPGVA